MTDVAQAAGVSQSTVSMVLNQVPGARLSDRTRTKVLGCAMTLGYRLPHRLPLPEIAGSRPPDSKQQPDDSLRFIGYLVDEISTSPHPVVSIDGARDAAWEQGCLLQVAVSRNDPSHEAAILSHWLAQPGLLGVVYSSIFTRTLEPPALLSKGARVPCVLLNCHDAARLHTAIVPAEVAGGLAATEYLLRQGHRRIGFINGEPWMEAAQDRLKGYRRALATADLPVDPDLVVPGDWMSGSGFAGTLQLMRLPRPPSAIFCANDLMALGALEALAQLGLKVPDDVSVMGYDDQEISRHTHPPLTTVVLPNYELGRTAVEQLLAQASKAASASGSASGSSKAKHGGPRRSLLKIDGPLVERQSVREWTAQASR